MKMPFLLISPKIVPKIQLIKKGGCFEYHAVIADKIKYRYVHRASICPALGMDRRSFFMPKPMGKYKRLEVFYLSKPVYTADKPSDCHYCYFWTNGRKGCRLGRNNCYYLISLTAETQVGMWWLSLWARSPVHWLVYEEGYAWSGASLIWMCMNRNTASTILPDVLTKRRIRLSAAFRWQQKVFRRKKVVKPCEFWLFLRSAIRSIHILSSSEGVVHEREVLEYFCRCQDAVWHFAWPHEPVCQEWLDR